MEQFVCYFFEQWLDFGKGGFVVVDYYCYSVVVSFERFVVDRVIKENIVLMFSSCSELFGGVGF